MNRKLKYTLFADFNAGGLFQNYIPTNFAILLEEIFALISLWCWRYRCFNFEWTVCCDVIWQSKYLTLTNPNSFNSTDAIPTHNLPI